MKRMLIRIDVRGDLSGVRGDLSGVRGDLDACEITKKEREKGINIKDLIKEQEDADTLG